MATDKSHVATSEALPARGLILGKPSTPVSVHIQGTASASEAQRVADRRFFQLGICYYIAALSSVFAGLDPVYGNLAHHAVEMLLKGKLVQTRSLAQLKKEFGHDLRKNWDAFKLLFTAVNLAEFDQVISDLGPFENLRYPDDYVQSGALTLVSYGGDEGGQGRPPSGAVRAMPRQDMPVYQLHLNDLDAFVKRVFDLCSLHPTDYFTKLNAEALRILLQDNRAWSQADIKTREPDST